MYSLAKYTRPSWETKRRTICFDLQVPRRATPRFRGPTQQKCNLALALELVLAVIVLKIERVGLERRIVSGRRRSSSDSLGYLVAN
jgi:hypothetical protein